MICGTVLSKSQVFCVPLFQYVERIPRYQNYLKTTSVLSNFPDITSAIPSPLLRLPFQPIPIVLTWKHLKLPSSSFSSVWYANAMALLPFSYSLRRFALDMVILYMHMVVVWKSICAETLECAQKEYQGMRGVWNVDEFEENYCAYRWGIGIWEMRWK